MNVHDVNLGSQRPDQVREDSAQTGERKRDVAYAQQAMSNIPPLSPERAQEILDHLKKGHYTAPDVLMKLAENLTRELGLQAGTPEAGGEPEPA